MADTPQDLLDKARAAAEAAQQAADIAHAYADQLAASAGAAAHAATGGAIDPFVFRFAIFILAIFVGYYVVWSVTPALHTPLMSVTNAISSVIVVGALLSVGVPLVGGTLGSGSLGGGSLAAESLAGTDGGALWARGFGFIALILASINIFGGFLVTERMLAMYRPKADKTDKPKQKPAKQKPAKAVSPPADGAAPSAGQ
jgi:proton-translocating NAD(P)+ transhydrogenase subunit alpha